MVILDPPTKGHVTKRMRNPKIAILRYVKPKGCLMILQVSLKLQRRSTREISRQYLHNENVPAMQYCDVITRWRTAAILKIAKSPYLNEKYHPILIKFGTIQQILNPMTVT